MTKPITKEKTVALDGIEFTVYTQRFEKHDDEIYVGCQAKTLTKPFLYRNFNATDMVSKKREATV